MVHFYFWTELFLMQQLIWTRLFVCLFRVFSSAAFLVWNYSTQEENHLEISNRITACTCTPFKVNYSVVTRPVERDGFVVGSMHPCLGKPQHAVSSSPAITRYSLAKYNNWLNKVFWNMALGKITYCCGELLKNFQASVSYMFCLFIKIENNTEFVF